jgi:predicted AAA+ superfamily ATPase
MIPPHYSDWIIIDEIQRIPEMLNEVHDLIESQKHIFILTGSNARKLRQKGINLLTGRALTVLPIEQALRDLKQLLRPL